MLIVNKFKIEVGLGIGVDLLILIGLIIVFIDFGWLMFSWIVLILVKFAVLIKFWKRKIFFCEVDILLLRICEIFELLLFIL